MKNAITSTQFAELKGDCLNLIGDLRDAQINLNKIHESAVDLNINLDRSADETEMAYLARLAANCAEQEHDMLKIEAVQEVNDVATKGTAALKPRSWFGRKLNQLSHVVG